MYLCAACSDPIGALRVFEIADREATGMHGAPGIVPTDGNRRRGSGPR